MADLAPEAKRERVPTMTERREADMRPPTTTPTPTPTASLDRALTLLRAVTVHGPVRADELADRLGLPLSTTYRYLRTLRAHGFVTDSDGLFGAGPVFEVSSTGGIGRAELIAVSMPFLTRLVALTEETAVLAIRVGFHAMCLHQVESPHPIRLAFRIGQALPLYAGAGQRTLLAHARPDVIQTVLCGPFLQYTPNTPTERTLARRLNSARLSGIATSRGELFPGSVAIASPVFCHEELVCSLTVAGPAARCGPAWQTHAKPSLRTEATRLGRILASTRPREPANQ